MGSPTLLPNLKTKYFRGWSFLLDFLFSWKFKIHSRHLGPKFKLFWILLGATNNMLSMSSNMHFYAPGDDSPHGGILLLLCPYVCMYVCMYVCPSLVKVFGYSFWLKFYTGLNYT